MHIRSSNSARPQHSQFVVILIPARQVKCNHQGRRYERGVLHAASEQGRAVSVVEHCRLTVCAKEEGQ